MQRKLYNSTKIDTLLTVQLYVQLYSMNNVEFHIKTHANCVYNEYANICDNYFVLRFFRYV